MATEMIFTADTEIIIIHSKPEPSLLSPYSYIVQQPNSGMKPRRPVVASVSRHLTSVVMKTGKS